jgi:hypothetical protein
MNILANRSQRNRMIPNHLLINHLLCKFSLWPPHNNPLTTNLTPRGMAGGGGEQTATKRRTIHEIRLNRSSANNAPSAAKSK